MSESMAPHAPPELLAQKVRKIFFGAERSSRAALLHCQGDPGVVDNVDIVPTTCEFELRREMARRRQSDRYTAYLVDWLDPDQLPLDLRARVAQRMVYPIRREEQLAYALGAKRLAADLRGSKLAQLALRADFESLAASPHLTLPLSRAASAWLGRELGGVWTWEWPDLETFLQALARESGLGGQKGDAVQADRLLGEVFQELQERVIGPQYGAIGRVALVAWLAGQMEELVPVLTVLDGLAAGEPADTSRTLVHKEIVRRYPRWGELACAQDWATVELRLDEVRGTLKEFSRSWTRTIEQLVAGIGHPELFAGSAWMSEGRSVREAQLGAALSGVARVSGKAAETTWAEVQSAVQELLAHHDFEDRAEDRSSIEMIARLVGAWCAEELDLDGKADLTRSLALAEEFAHEGGYRDWARRIVRHASLGVWTEPLQQGLSDLLSAVDEREEERDRRFAEGMRLWAEAGRPPRGVLPIERASKELVQGFLGGDEDEAPTRRMLVLLMDGMSWNRCRELLEGLHDQDWSSLRWRPKGYQGKRMPAMLAAFPTITAVSRSAFFQGALPESGKLPSSSQDGKRWRENPALQTYRHHEKGLPLFFKDKIEGPDGVDPEVLEAIRKDELPLVAAIVNAYDDFLKAGRGVEVDLSEKSLTAIRRILGAAREGGRAVLLVADHGHVPGQRLTTVPGGSSDSDARWRPLGLKGESLAPEEVEIAGPGVWSRVPGQPICMLRGETARYKTHSAQGEHGGVSLQEVVSPAVLIGHADLFDGEDLELSDDAPAEPPWWDWSTWRPAAAKLELKGPPKPHPTLFPDAVPAAKEKPEPETQGWIEELVKSDTFRTAMKMAALPEAVRQKVPQQVRALLELLHHRGGRAPFTAVAQCLQVSERRVTGALTRLQSALTPEGYRCLDLETETQTVKLDRELLAMAFGVEVPE